MLKQALQSEGGEAAGRRRCRAAAELDSAALAVLLEVERLAVAWGRAFAVRGAPPKLAALAKLYGVDVLLLKPEAGRRRARAADADQRRPAR